MTDRSENVARLQFLGSQKVVIGSTSVTPDAERLFALLVRLSVPLGRITSRQTVMETLWPGADEANARHNLRQTVYKARELGLVVESGEDGLRLSPRHWSCDWDDPVADVSGPWLEGYEPAFSAELRAWVTAQRVAVHALIRPRVVRSLQRARAGGALQVADAHAQQLLSIDELNEEAILTRAEVLALHGSKVDALKLLDGYLVEMGELGSGKEASLPAEMLRRRIAEKLPTVSYQAGAAHRGPLIGRDVEMQHLRALLFDTRAGRGSGILLHGIDGVGKSRMLHELKDVAIVQGVITLGFDCSNVPAVRTFALLRSIASTLLQRRGAMGITAEALAAIRAWVAADGTASDSCPIEAIEDLFAAVSEEAPFVMMVDDAERIDGASLVALDSIYRAGQSRFHSLLVAASSPSPASGSAGPLTWIRMMQIRALSQRDTEAIVASYARGALPQASETQIACAALFAAGIPMYGIEMLGLSLDAGSPDVIPWRVQESVDAALRSLSELQRRILAISVLAPAVATREGLAAVFAPDERDLATHVTSLEDAGLLRFEDGVFKPMRLIADAAAQRVSASDVRGDALKAGQALVAMWPDAPNASSFYEAIRAFVVAKDEVHAEAFLEKQTTALVLRDTAQSIVFEFSGLTKEAGTTALREMLSTICEQLLLGSHGKRTDGRRTLSVSKRRSLPTVAGTQIDSSYSLEMNRHFTTALTAARDPNSPPSQRLADAVMALAYASEVGDLQLLAAANGAVSAVRHGPDVAAFDLRRADMIYSATTGDREAALAHAEQIAKHCAGLPEVNLACVGLRNAATVFSGYGNLARAQSVLHESRELAVRLAYTKQIIYADIRLADLALEAMDTAAARAYLESAQRLVESHQLDTPVTFSDRFLIACWEAIVSGDSVRAAKEAKRYERATRSDPIGVGHWSYVRLSVKLATHTAPRTSDFEDTFARLRQSIGNVPFYWTEDWSLAALLLASKLTGEHDSTVDFVESHRARIEQRGKQLWPFVTRLMAR